MDTNQPTNEMFKKTITRFIASTIYGMMNWSEMDEGEDKESESNRLMFVIHKASTLIADELEKGLQNGYIAQIQFDEHMEALVDNVDFAEDILMGTIIVPANTTIH